MNRKFVGHVHCYKCGMHVGDKVEIFGEEHITTNPNVYGGCLVKDNQELHYCKEHYEGGKP